MRFWLNIVREPSKDDWDIKKVLQINETVQENVTDKRVSYEFGNGDQRAAGSDSITRGTHKMWSDRKGWLCKCVDLLYD